MAVTAVTAANQTSSTGLSRDVAVPLAYAGWCFTGLILWFLERRDPAIRFHAAQSVTAFGLISLLVVLLGGSALVSLSFLPAAFNPLMWATVATWIAGILLWIAVMLRAATGDAWRIPIAADLAERLMRRP